MRHLHSVIPANRELLPCQSAETGGAATAAPHAPTVVISPVSPLAPPPPHQHAVPSAPTQHVPPSYPATSAYPQQPVHYQSQYPTYVLPHLTSPPTAPSALCAGVWRSRFCACANEPSDDRLVAREPLGW